MPLRFTTRYVLWVIAVVALAVCIVPFVRARLQPAPVVIKPAAGSVEEQERKQQFDRLLRKIAP